MPRGHNKHKKSVKKTTQVAISEDYDIDRDDKSCQHRSSSRRNRNSNHAMTDHTSLKEKDVKHQFQSQDKTMQRSKSVKSKVVAVSKAAGKNAKPLHDPHTEVFQFEEEGEIIQMEINDGGAAAAEFASEEE